MSRESVFGMGTSMVMDVGFFSLSVSHTLSLAIETGNLLYNFYLFKS